MKKNIIYQKVIEKSDEIGADVDTVVMVTMEENFYAVWLNSHMVSFGMLAIFGIENKYRALEAAVDFGRMGVSELESRVLNKDAIFDVPF